MTDFQVGQTVYYPVFTWLEKGLKVEIKSGEVKEVNDPMLELTDGSRQYISDCFSTEEHAKQATKNYLVKAERHFKDKAKVVAKMAAMKWSENELKYEL